MNEGRDAPAENPASTPDDARPVLHSLWQAAGLAPEALQALELPPPGGEVLPSAFANTAALQASLGAAALAAAQLGRARGGPAQDLRVEAEHAVLECLAWFTLDGRQPELWDPISGLYRCADGWVRVHANFAHHRDGVLRLLGLAPGQQTERSAVQAALAGWSALAFEADAAQAGLVVAAVRSFAEWDAHPQAAALAQQPLVPVHLERLGDAAPRPLRPWQAGGQPLDGLRVLELTRILAGPVAGRLLAGYGADVLLLNSPHLPNIAALAATSCGKLSAHLDLNEAGGPDALAQLLRGADVFLQAYRPGALAARGFSPAAVTALSPGIVVVSLSAYGPSGPWAGRRGFDSLVQTATGFNVAEAAAFGGAEPRALPLQVLDHAAGHLLAFGAQAALLRQAQEGGSWHVQVSLAGVGRWLRSLGRTLPVAAGRPPLAPYVETLDSGFGRLQTLRHAAQFSATPAGWRRPSMPPGSHPAAWPGPG